MLVILSGLAGAWPEWDRIQVPDTFGVPSCVGGIALDRVRGRLFVCGLLTDSILVVDDTAGEPTARFHVGVRDTGSSCIAYSNLYNKLYCGLYAADSIAVVDSSGSALTMVTTLGSPVALVSDSAGRKVYCGDDSGALTILDCATDSMLLQFRVADSTPGWVQFLCAEDEDIAYCGGRGLDTLYGIDMDSDTVVARIPAPGGVFQLEYYPDLGLLYCGRVAGPAIDIIDVHTNQVTHGVPVWRDYPFCLNRRWGRLYYAESTRVAAVDATTGEVVASTYVYNRRPWVSGAYCSPYGSSVYAMCAGLGEPWGDMAVVACSDDSVVAFEAMGVCDPFACLYSGQSGRLVLLDKSGAVAGVDCHSHRVNMLLARGWNVVRILATNRHEIVSYCCPRPSALLVWDPVSQRATHRIPVPTEAYYDAEVMIVREDATRAFLLSDWPWLGVIDLVGDTLVSVDFDDPPGFPMCFGPGDSKLYATDGRWVVVLDGLTGGRLGRIPLHGTPDAMVCDTANRKLYVTTGADSLFCIDCAADTVVDCLPVGPGDHVLCMDPVRARLYCAASEDRDVRVLDCGTNTFVAEIRAQPGTRGMCFVPGFDRVYVAAENLYMIDCVESAVGVVLPGLGFATWLCYHDRTRQIVTADSRGWATFLDCETHAVVANVDITWCLCPPGQLLAAQWSDATYGLADEGDPYIYKLRAGPLMRLPVEATAAPLRATVVADRLPMTVGMRGQLVDACGRVVRELLPGENDVSEVAPGVYFVREWPALLMRDSVTTRRVVIVH